MKMSGTKLLIGQILLVLSLSACNEKSSNINTNDSNANAAKTADAKTGVKPQADPEHRNSSG